MAYIADRVVHDADAHIMETPNWLRDYADPEIRAQIVGPSYANELAQTGDGDPEGRDIDAVFARLAERHRTSEFLDDEEAEVMMRKNFAATGSFLAEDRPRVLDFIGVESQLMFNTFHNSRLFEWEHRPDLDFAYGTARAHNRGMVEFCSVDPRLLPTCYVPLVDFDRADAMAREAIEMGAAALLVASGCPAGHSPSHIALDPVWRQAEEAGIPVVFHVGGTGDLIDPGYFNNGLPIPADFHGGEENFRSVDYMAIPFPPMQTLATMIFDGVLDRFPTLKIGVIEQGCIWLPSWMKQMESAMDAFARHEERLQKLSMRPSDFVERQIRVTPYPTEDVGWVTEQIGPNVLLFNTDYPHVEGGRRPYERFEKSLGDASEETRQRFYADNYIDMMGSAVAALV
ncbi:MAG: amidohydrolase family protein [Actinobacteria bacterium]|jgi:predicted TIM-barrel fold metal-dependent hydrolase|nr:amidohydrolase family protein [Actinomycetota bacterium]